MPPAHYEVPITTYRYAWREPATGRKGWGTWCSDRRIVEAAIKQFRLNEPALEIWLEKRAR